MSAPLGAERINACVMSDAAGFTQAASVLNGVLERVAASLFKLAAARASNSLARKSRASMGAKWSSGSIVQCT
jgi:hypothetical protein